MRVFPHLTLIGEQFAVVAAECMQAPRVVLVPSRLRVIPHTLKHWRITSGDKAAHASLTHAATCPLLGDILPLASSLV